MRFSGLPLKFYSHAVCPTFFIRTELSEETMSSEKRSASISVQPLVTIGDRVWVECRSIILPGVKIGNDVVIAAGSVVTGDIPDRVIAGGVPARVLKHIQSSIIILAFRDPVTVDIIKPGRRALRGMGSQVSC